MKIEVGLVDHLNEAKTRSFNPTKSPQKGLSELECMDLICRAVHEYRTGKQPGQEGDVLFSTVRENGGEIITDSSTENGVFSPQITHAILLTGLKLAKSAIDPVRNLRDQGASKLLRAVFLETLDTAGDHGTTYQTDRYLLGGFSGRVLFADIESGRVNGIEKEVALIIRAESD